MMLCHPSTAAPLFGLLVVLCLSGDVTSRELVVRTPSGALRGTTMTSRAGRTIFAFRGLRYAEPPVGDLRFKVMASSGPVARTPSGAVRGTTMTSRSGRTIFAFRGLRYGKSPVGELRFKAPVPYTETWSGIKNATEDGASCPQAADFLGGNKSEDCLFLNVYSTKLPNRENNPRYPVVFWIHHGGWFELSGQSSLAGPQYLMDEDIVLVTINYRLAALGFLSTGDSESPGNYGLKDQLLAMKWVRDNIESFGGDPNLVTLYGYSAGGASIQYHMMSPRSAGLFHRAISGSGSALSPWAFNKDPMSLARRFAKLLDYPNAEGATSKEIVEYLRGKDAEELVRAHSGLREWQFDPLVVFAPVVEAEGSSPEPFLTEDPTSVLQLGKFAQVPWLTGSTNNEWMRRATEILGNETVLEDFNQNFERIAPIVFYYERDTPSSVRKSRVLKEFYLGNRPATEASRQAITDLYTDGMFLHGADRSVKLISSVSRAPVYYYQFVYRGRFGHMPKEEGMDKPPGAVHHDDLIYIFYGDGLFPFFGIGFPEIVTSKRMVRMWANFARTGNPTPDTRTNRDSLLTTNWIAHTPAGLSYMEIGDNLTMKRALRQERAAVWDQIYPMNARAQHRS